MIVYKQKYIQENMFTIVEVLEFCLVSCLVLIPFYGQHCVTIELKRDKHNTVNANSIILDWVHINMRLVLLNIFSPMFVIFDI